MHGRPACFHVTTKATDLENSSPDLLQRKLRSCSVLFFRRSSRILIDFQKKLMQMPGDQPFLARATTLAADIIADNRKSLKPLNNTVPGRIRPKGEASLHTVVETHLVTRLSFKLSSYLGYYSVYSVNCFSEFLIINAYEMCILDLGPYGSIVTSQYISDSSNGTLFMILNYQYVVITGSRTL